MSDTIYTVDTLGDDALSESYSNFLGYKKGANPGDMEIVEEEAVIVRRIYDEYLAGKSPGDIAKRLTADGIPTPAKKTRWHPSTIISILHNEKYRGDAKLQKCFTTSFLDHKVQKNTGQLPIFYVSENHPAIIKPEVFEMLFTCRYSGRRWFTRLAVSFIIIYRTRSLCFRISAPIPF